MLQSCNILLSHSRVCVCVFNAVNFVNLLYCTVTGLTLSLFNVLYLSVLHVLNTETRQAFSKLLALTLEPKSVEIRKGSQKVITDLFNLNTAGFSLMLRGVPRNLQVLTD